MIDVDHALRLRAVWAALALQRAGVLDKTEAGQVVFPYESVKVEFLLQAA